MLPENSRIRLAPPEEAEPHRAYIPTAHAIHWRSSFETDAEANFESVRLKPGASVFMTKRAYVRCCAHAASDLRNEVGGGLVGQRRVDANTGQPFIVVEAALPARYTRQGSTFLTFTQDSLVALHDDLSERHSDKELLGWYHTHPHMGVFLSGYDVWLHKHFFPNPWQVALVIEPYSSQGGFFIHQPDGQLDPRRYFGFYELSKNGQRSVMYWRNLWLDTTPLPSEGGRQHE